MKKTIPFFLALLFLGFFFSIFFLPLPISATSPRDNFVQLRLDTTNPYYSTSPAEEDWQFNQFRFSFQTAKTVPNGQFVVAVPTTRLPAPEIENLICPNSVSGQFEFLTPLATPSASVDGYDFYSCPYLGAGLAGSNFLSNLLLINQFPNPTASTSTQPQVNPHQVYFAQLPQTVNFNNPEIMADFVVLNYGLIEQNKLEQLTAQKAAQNNGQSPDQLSFKITGLPARSQVCGRTTLVSTQANQVNFEDLTSDKFSVAAQRVAFQTTANFGYLVTTFQNDQLGLNGTSCAGADAIGNPACIPDVTAYNLTPYRSANWTDPLTQPGLGFTLENLSHTSAAVFTFNSPAPSATINLFRQFSDQSATEQPVAIFRRLAATINNGDEANICYQISPTLENSMGTYKNQIIYTVTATF